MCPSSSDAAVRVVLTLSGRVSAASAAKIAALVQSTSRISSTDRAARESRLLEELLATMEQSRMRLAFYSEDQELEKDLSGLKVN